MNQGGPVATLTNLELDGNSLQSTTQDTALTITQDTNTSGGGAKDLALETIDSASTNVGNIVLDADRDNDSAADIVFNTSGTERGRVTGSGLQIDNLTDNGAGSMTLGNTLDVNGNTITDTSDNLTLEATGGSANVELNSSDLELNGNNITSTGGSYTLEASGNNVQLGDNLDSNGNLITNAGTSDLSLAGGGNTVKLLSTLNLNGNIIDNNNGSVYQQRGDPSTTEVPSGEAMTYVSDGSGTGSAGDLVYAVNDGGSIKTVIIAQRSNAT